MKDTKEELIRDTIAFLKQERLLSPPAPEKLIFKGAVPPAKQRRKLKSATPQAPPPPSQAKVERSETRESALLIKVIQKHLPHIPIVETIPEIRKVLIACRDEEDLPFMENLKRAIEKRFCPCDLAMEMPSKLDPFTCVLSSVGVDGSIHIPLERASVYRDDIDKKRALWNHICQTLSPKSS